MVEKPQIYLMARSGDTIEDQLLYNDTHLEDIQQLTTKKDHLFAQRVNQ